MAGQNFKIGVDDKEALDAFTKLEKESSRLTQKMEELGVSVDGVFDPSSIDKYITNLDDAKRTLTELVELNKIMGKIYTDMVQDRSGLFTTDDIEKASKEYDLFYEALTKADRAVKVLTKQEALKVSGIDVAINEVEELERKYKEVSKSISLSLDKIERAGSTVIMRKDGDLESQLESWSNYVNVLEDTVPKLEKYSSDMSKLGVSIDSKPLKEANTIIKDYNNQVDFAKSRVNDLSKQIGVSTTSAKKFSTQLLDIKDEMTALTLSGDTESQRYKELEQELERVGTAYRKVGQEQKNLTRAGSAVVGGLLQGFQAIAGTFTLIQGLSSLISSDSEDVAEAQKKLQQAMAITMGIQQVSTALHSTSKLRLGLVSKATNLLTIAQNRLAIAFNGSTIAARAFMGAVTLGLGVAITAAIVAYNKYADAQEKAYKIQKEIADKQREIDDSISKSLGSQLSTLKSLQLGWDSLGNSLLDKKKYIKENAEAFKSLGYEVGTVSDAESILVNNTSKVIEAMQFRAEAAATKDLASEEYKKAVRARIEADKFIVDSAKEFEINGKKFSLEDPNKQLSEFDKNIQGVISSNKKLFDNTADEAKKQGDAYIEHFNKLTEKAKSLDLSLKLTPKKDKKEEREEEKRLKDYNKLVLDQTKTLAKEREELERSHIDKRIKMLQYESNKRIEQIKVEEKELLYAKNKINQSNIALIKSLENEMSFFKGNVDLLTRPLIDAANLVKKGWEDAGDGIATVYSSQFGIEDADGLVREILVTPILPNGDVLSPDELDSYIYDKLEGAKDILRADDLGIVISADVDTDGLDGDKLHKLQELYYDKLSKVKIPLSKSEKDFFDQRYKIALDYYEKEIQKENEAQEKSNKAKLDSFKSFYQQRQDIIDKYNKYIDVAEKLGLDKSTVDNIRKELEKELSRLDFSEVMKTQDLGGLFEDLSKKSTESISVIIAELKRLRDANIKAWSIEELKIFNDQISKGESITRDRSPLDSIRKGLEEYQQATEEVEYVQKKINELDKDSVGYNEKLAKLRARQLSAMDGQTDAQKKINNAVNSMGKGVKDISGAMGDAVDMLGNFGIELNDSISTAIKGLGQMGDALSELDITKPGTLITSSVKWISGLGNIVSSFFGGGKKEVTETQIREYEALTSSIERSIQAQKELLNITAGIEAQKATDEAIKMLNRQKDAARNMYVETVDSYYKKNRTLGVRMRKDLEPYRKEIENVGISWDQIVGSGRMEGLVFLSGEELAALRDIPEVWAAIDDEAKKHLETIIESDEAALKLKEDLKEALTGTTFEGFLDGVANEISKFKGDITDLGDFTEDTLKKSLINAYKQDVLRKALEPMYDRLAVILNKDIEDLSPTELEDWGDDLNKLIAKERQDFKDKLAYLGIDIDKGEMKPPKASQGYQVSMSQDTGNEILGLVRNMQMIGLNQEQELIKQTEFLSTFGIQFGGMQQELESISSVSLQSMYYLRDIEKHTKTLHDVGDILSKIEKNTQ